MEQRQSKLMMESRANGGGGFDEKRTLLMSRGTTQTAHKSSQPLLYVPAKK